MSVPQRVTGYFCPKCGAVCRPTETCHGRLPINHAEADRIIAEREARARADELERRLDDA